MTDTFSKKFRSAIMRKIRNKNTRLEVAVRKILWRKGIRYRLHGNVYGRPDVVCPSARIAVFIDSCFWHGCKRHLRMPGSNRGYWQHKIFRNRKRREQVTRRLRSMGWRVVRLWEHENRSAIEEKAELIRKMINASNGR